MPKYEINFTSGGGGGATDVAVDPTEPVSPDILLWVDSDADGTSTFRNIVSTTEPDGFVGDNWVKPLANLVLGGYLTNTAQWKLNYGFGYATAVATPGTGVMSLSNASTTAQAMTRPTTIYSDCTTGDFCYVEIDVTNIVGRVRATQAFTRSGPWSVGTGTQTMSLYASWVNQDFGLELDTESSVDVSAVRFYNVSKHSTLLYAYNVDNTWTPLTAPQNYKGRNRIINGDFSVNQRSFTSLVVNGTTPFTFDRWRFTGSGGSHTVSSEVAVAGTLPESAARFLRIVTTAGQDPATARASFQQPIENVRVLSGKTATVSFWARAGSGTPKVSVDLWQAFGTGGSTSVSAIFGQVTLSTSWQRYSLTMPVPSMTGKTVGSDSHLDLNIWVSAGTNNNVYTNSLGIQNNTFDFWGVQVEEGPIATPFEVLPYVEQLRNCHRYFYRHSGSTAAWAKYGSGVVNTATSAIILFHLPVSMRIPPTLTMAGGAHMLWDASAVPVVTSYVADMVTTDIYSADISASAGGLTVGRGAMVMNNANTTGYIEFDAEF